MRIVVAHDSLGTEGGVETYLLSVIGALRSRGHQIALLYYRRSAVPGALGSSAHVAVGVEERGLDGALTDLQAWRPDVGFSHNMSQLAVDRGLTERWPTV